MQPAKLLSKYNEFFDKGCVGIWGLSPLLKYTLLYLALFFVPAIFGLIKLNEDTSTTFTYIGIYIIGALVIAFIWFFYLPILCLILIYRFIKKGRLFLKEGIKIRIEIKENAASGEINSRDGKRDVVLHVTDLGKIYYYFVVRLVQFYPFSYLYKDRLFHPSNKKLKRFISKIETIARKASAHILIYGSQVDSSIYQFNAAIKKPLRRNGLKKLETTLQDKLGTIYVRKDKKNYIRIIMPLDTFERLQI